MRFFATLALAASLTACATVNPAAAEFRAWSQETKAKADQGQVSYSSFYTQAYDKLSAMPGSDPGKTTLMRLYAELIPLARAYEAGTISKDQLDDARRQATLALQQHRDAAAAQQQQAIAASIKQAADNMIRATPPPTYQVIQPPVVLQAPAPRLGPITCQSYRNFGGQIQTDCN